MSRLWCLLFGHSWEYSGRVRTCDRPACRGRKHATERLDSRGDWMSL